MSKVHLIIILVIVLAACGDNKNTSQQPEDSPLLETEVNTDNLAALVNGQSITRERLQIEVVARAATSSQAADAATVETVILEELINQILTEQFAAANNIVVTDEQVQAEIQVLNEAASAQNKSLSDITNYPADMTDEIVYITLLTQAVRDYLISQLPETVTQVHARHILVKNEQAAQDIISQLEEGADFADLAQQFSKDGSTAPDGGDLGWIAPGDLLQADVESAIFALPPNSRWPEPIASSLGYHVVEVLEHDNTIPLNDEQKVRYYQRAYATWLEEQRNTATILRYIGQNAD